MMKFRLLPIITVFALAVFSMQAQNVTLFTVDNVPVPLSEFKYIYEKNNGEDADYSQKSVNEYLDLYIKFKLKVAKAKQLQLDTIVSLQKELAGYRKQLASSYLVDRELSDKLVEEVYQRKQKDIRVSHILLNCNENAPPEHHEFTRNQAVKIRARIESGADFKLIAQTLSEDKGSSYTGGNLGWMTAMLPDGFYDFENAMYSLDIGEVSEPIQSSLGYHILKVTDIREARGEMEVAHILIRTKAKGRTAEEAKVKIDSIYQELQNGSPFEKEARHLSEDKNTAPKGGYLGFFGIGQFELVFENKAFELKKDGEYSAPLQTSIGWHIVKRISKKDYQEKQLMKRSLEPLVAKNDRFEIAKEAMIEQIKKNAKFHLDQPLLESFINELDQDFYSYRWQIPALKNGVLCRFGRDTEYRLEDFAQYCKSNTRRRLRFDKEELLSNAIQIMIKEYIADRAIAYEESHLEEKYPDFKALMREYSEGILLFEATKINVWDRAPKDIEGLEKFYENNKNQYVWADRAQLHKFVIYTDNVPLINDIYRTIQLESPEQVLAKFNGEKKVVELETTTYEKGSSELIDLVWEEGAVSKPSFDLRNNKTAIKKLGKIIASTQKTMNEAKGYIIADYQDKLEKEWVDQLRQEFSVQIDEQVLKSITKS